MMIEFVKAKDLPARFTAALPSRYSEATAMPEGARMRVTLQGQGVLLRPSARVVIVRRNTRPANDVTTKG